MRTLIVAAAVAALSLAVAPEASAQVIVSRTWAPATAIGGAVSGATGSVFPYSYYVTMPYPAREYVPYGPSDTFAFYGDPYGHPYDRWTWPYLSGGFYNRSLRRYFYPPVP